LEVREKFESLLTEINGLWNAMQQTLSAIPITDGRLLQVANARLITFMNEWNPPLTSNVTTLALKQYTREFVQAINVAVDDLALNQLCELEETKIKAKQAEMADFFKNHLQNADFNVFENWLSRIALALAIILYL